MCLLSGPWRQAKLWPLPHVLPTRAPRLLQGLDLACLGVGNLQFGRERTLGLMGPLWQRPARACSHLPPPTHPGRLPQEHKAEVKASMKASFPAVGAAGARALTHGTWHGSSAHRHGDAPTSWARQDTRSQDPTHSWLSVHRPPVCQNPEQSQSWVPVGWGWTPRRRTGLAKLQASSGSLKGNELGAAGRWGLGRVWPGTQASLSISGPQ